MVEHGVTRRSGYSHPQLAGSLRGDHVVGGNCGGKTPFRRGRFVRWNVTMLSGATAAAWRWPSSSGEHMACVPGGLLLPLIDASLTALCVTH